MITWQKKRQMCKAIGISSIAKFTQNEVKEMRKKQTKKQKRTTTEVIIPRKQKINKQEIVPGVCRQLEFKSSLQHLPTCLVSLLLNYIHIHTTRAHSWNIFLAKKCF